MLDIFFKNVSNALLFLPICSFYLFIYLFHHLLLDSEKVNENIDKILEAVKKIQADAETLLPKIADVKDKEVGDMIESEMQSTTIAIELAAERIEVRFFVLGFVFFSLIILGHFCGFFFVFLGFF